MLKHWTYLLFMMVAGFSGQVLAHPGSHAEFSSWEQLAHYFSQPYHLAGVIILAAVITGLVVWHQWHRR